MTEISISPVTRISGLLSVELCLDQSGRVAEANCSGEQFRGFEIMLKGRQITDAVYFTQRICGICSMAHGFVSARLIASIYGVNYTPETSLLQQLMLGAEFLQNHIRHFYLLALPDYLDTNSLPDFAIPVVTSDGDQSRFTKAQQHTLVEHYFAAMEYSRKCHEMLAIFGGKIPHQHGLVSEGVTLTPTADRRLQFSSLLCQVREFIETIMLPDLYLLENVYPDYYEIGLGTTNFISYGLFDPKLGGHFPAGVYIAGQLFPVNPEEIRQSITYAWYKDIDSQPIPDPEKPGAYSWVKAPRYRGIALEGGPLARKIIASGYQTSTSTGVMGRLLARGEEAATIASWMDAWLNDLPQNGKYIQALTNQALNHAVATFDAPRGPLLHSMTVADNKIDSYRVITPSNWNFSPKDDSGQRGPAEAALIGALVDGGNPIVPGRIIRSFDPCLSCATHLIDWEGKNRMRLEIKV